jgi:hypothetical protein
MPKFIIERNVPSFGNSTHEQLKHATETSNNAIYSMNNRVQWLESFVTRDKIYCVYISPDKESVMEHAQKSGFPADSVEEVKTMLDPVYGG